MPIYRLSGRKYSLQIVLPEKWLCSKYMERMLTHLNLVALNYTNNLKSHYRALQLPILPQGRSFSQEQPKR